MKLTTKTFFAAAALALMSTSAMAQDIAVIAGSVEDAFMDKIKKGVDDATTMVTANGGTVQFLRTQNYENFGPDLVTLINQAVAQGVEGIAIPIWVQRRRSLRCKRHGRRASSLCNTTLACQW